LDTEKRRAIVQLARETRPDMDVFGRLMRSAFTSMAFSAIADESVIQREAHVQQTTVLAMDYLRHWLLVVKEIHRELAGVFGDLSRLPAEQGLVSPSAAAAASPSTSAQGNDQQGGFMKLSFN
jgi:hypothetical protein